MSLAGPMAAVISWFANFKFSNLLYCPYEQSELVDVTRMINFKPLVQLLFVLSHWVQAITLYSLRMQFNTLPIK